MTAVGLVERSVRKKDDKVSVRLLHFDKIIAHIRRVLVPIILDSFVVSPNCNLLFEGLVGLREYTLLAIVKVERRERLLLWSMLYGFDEEASHN